MVHYRIVKVSVRFAVYFGASYDTVIGLIAVSVLLFFLFFSFFSQGFGALAECISTCSMTLFRHVMSMLLKLMTYGLEG